MSTFEQLKLLQEKAYAPYSNFPVAALLVLGNGEVVPGVNVENKAFGSTICAERSAFVSAISRYGAEVGFRELHLIAGKGHEFSSPCGCCRQVMSELVQQDFLITLYNVTGETQAYRMQDLLPFEFNGPTD